MIDRLANQVGSVVTGADRNFYTHELLENQYMGVGMNYDDAHRAALMNDGVSDFAIYHPDVIRQFPDYFNNSWRSYWGIK